MSGSKIYTYVTNTSVNRIQDGLDEITSIWGLNSLGSQRVQKNDICRASVINTWLSWINRYRSHVGVDQNRLKYVSEVHPGDPMNLNIIDTMYDNTQIIKNWCNRIECNSDECNSDECNDDECDDGESNFFECNDDECNDSECDAEECDDSESDDWD